ncbi:LysR family transcriptional regulator [Sporosarcina newyorkensis]|uniref:DNA-binding transcriptional regulator, LysR family n=1 Tax=Sporosarcina newyorkensis TaxID=759851 RepID=A0A1T4Y9P3_9BACL|nr:LysR family transcriptional regulator [Sporosarcina newyorkensis]SKA98011.1 DNA-binding transcriptional regulator, LysR family [Sporosarcina newyorkensis]
MELRLLNYFRAVCEELHFTRAAEKLGISQPTLSHQIRLLEDRLDTKLFSRVGKKIELTPAGSILLEHANLVYSENERTIEKIEELKGLSRGQLRIGSSGNHLLYAPLLSFYEKYPNIKLAAFDLTSEDIIQKILRFEIDVGVIFLPVYHELLQSIPLFTSELSAAVSYVHPLASREQIYMEELQHHPTFLLPKHYLLRQTIDNHCIKSGFSLNPVVELSDIYSLVRMTVLHNGITILPKIYANNVTDLPVKLLDIADALPKNEVGLIFPKGDFTSSAVQAFIQHVTSYYDSHN